MFVRFKSYIFSIITHLIKELLRRKCWEFLIFNWINFLLSYLSKISTGGASNSQSRIPGNQSRRNLTLLSNHSLPLVFWVPQSNFETNRSRGSWDMIGHHNKQTHRHPHTLYVYIDILYIINPLYNQLTRNFLLILI